MTGREERLPHRVSIINFKKVMKIKNLFITLFAASALFACNDDESLVPDNNQGTKSISVSLAGISGVKKPETFSPKIR